MAEHDALIIKRYPNRKLYDTQAKKYITLEAIEQFIRAGRDVRVLDNETGEDITNVTLSNIILETQKKPGGLLPKFVFTDLIQRGGQKVVELTRGMVGRVFGGAHDVEGQVRRTVNDLVQAGKLGKDQAEAVCASLVRNLSEGRERVEAAFSDRFEGILHRMNLPTSKDMERIRGALQALEKRIDAFGDPGAEKKPPRSRKKKAAVTEG